jgi:hypothetical protein
MFFHCHAGIASGLNPSASFKDMLLRPGIDEPMRPLTSVDPARLTALPDLSGIIEVAGP